MIETFLLIVNLVVALALVGVILMQRSEGGGLGMGGGGGGGGGMSGFMSARGASNFLTRATAILAGVFMVLSLVLAVMGQGRRATSPFEVPVGGPAIPGPSAPVGTPATPFIPPGAVPPAGPAPAAPATPAPPSPTGAPVGR